MDKCKIGSSAVCWESPWTGMGIGRIECSVGFIGLAVLAYVFMFAPIVYNFGLVDPWNF